MTLLGITLFTLLAVLSIYLFRVSLGKWIIADYIGQGAQVTCLEFDVGFSPNLFIKNLCLNNKSVSVEMQNASWYLDDWQSKASRLNIATLLIEHKDVGIQTSKHAKAAPALPDIALSASLPRITVQSLTLKSYLLQKPIKLALKQRSVSTFTLSGDINASLDYLDGALQGKINWVMADVLKQSPVLHERTQVLYEWLNWEEVVNAKINSTFSMAADRIETTHELSINPQLKLERCPVSMSAKGTINIDLTLSNFEGHIDVSDFPIFSDLKQCQLIPLQLKGQNLEIAQLIATQPFLITNNALSTTGIELRLPELQRDPVVRLSDITFSFRNDLEQDLEQDLALDYALELASNLADLQYLEAPKHAQNNAVLNDAQSDDRLAKTDLFASDLLGEDLALSGLVDITSKGKLTRRDGLWTIVSESADVNINALSSHLASAKRLSNSFRYKLSFAPSGQFDLSLSGKQRITGISTVPKDSLKLHIRELTTDWEIIPLNSEAWQITLTNDMPELVLAKARLLKLNNVSDILVTKDSQLQLTGKTKLQSISYTDKIVNDVSMDHELLTLLKNGEIQGSHTLSLGSGVYMQITHTDKDINMLMPQQDIKPLQKLVKQFNSKIQLVTGTMSAEVSGVLSAVDYLGSIKLADTSLKYDDYQVLLLQIDERFRFNSAGLQLSSGRISIDEVNVGIPIRQVEMLVDIVNNAAKLQWAQGELIGGTFKVTDLWLDGRKQRTNISVSSLDLADIVALQKQEGIQVTGEMSGILPFQFGSDNGIIESGLLASDGPGQLKIQNNPAFESIKSQQEQLSFLQNVEYRKLSSKVELASDGWLDLELAIAGRNPDKKQEVIFNYGHKENIFTLLKSLRISSAIQESIEKRVAERIAERTESQTNKRKPEKGR